MSTEHVARTDSTDRAATSGDSYDNLEPRFGALAAMDPHDPARARLRAEIITAAMPLGENVARRYAGRGVEYEDLAQIAAVGVVLAVDRFDPGHGASFLGFAIPTIMGEVKRYFRDSTWAVRVPRRTKEIQQQLAKVLPELAQRLGREPKAREIAEHLGVDIVEVTQGLIARNSHTADSLDAMLTATDDSSTYSPANTLGNVDAGYALMEDTLTAGPLLAALPEQEREILIMRFGQEKSQAQIAAILGVSQMQVSRILTRVLGELRAQCLQPV
ncbi:SigB/SigF/SigG family RNA polymerase sigma factor [Nocardia jejuensis]|uniref:SigB/SigF/SigG family RNA polymerase sigma factor n=1 Tax=Nocardia jejuensis TaxID=328049 RepID=UPI00082CA12D|nr:SigB/SigF/SigG family RNA polymerase sigma factor [Nocardia jejuensis]